MNKIFRSVRCVLVAAGLFAGCLALASTLPDAGVRDLFRLDVGTGEAEELLGFGWSQKEGDAVRRFRWVTQMEADVRFTLDAPKDAELWMEAQPLYLNWKQQRVGVFVNHQYVGQWAFPLAPGYVVHSIDLPAEMLVAGENVLTLRMGYRSGFSYDKREMAIGVDMLVLRAKEP